MRIERSWTHWQILLISLAVIVAAVFSGLSMTEKQIDARRTEMLRQSATDLHDIELQIQAEISNNAAALKALSQSIHIQNFLGNGQSAGLAAVNQRLDQFAEAFSVSVLYLMDKDGNTLASSNRNKPDSFVGKNYAFRPYFINAMEGRSDYFLNVGTTSGKRGIYFSHPVRDKDGHPIGAIVAKTEVEAFERGMRNLDALLVSPEGVIFLSSLPEMLLSALWPIQPDSLERLRQSKEFGPGPFNPAFSRVLQSGSSVPLKGEDRLFHIQPALKVGWSLAIFSPATELDSHRRSGYLLTALCCLLLGLLSWIFLSRLRTAAELRASEAALTVVINSLDEGVFVTDTSGRISRLNRAAERMSGWSEAEAIGLPVESVIALRDSETGQTALNAARIVLRDGKAFAPLAPAQIISRQGGAVTVRRRATPLCDSAGNMEGVATVVRDITAEHDHTLRLMSIFNTTSTGLVIVSLKEKRIVDVNKAALRMLEMGKDEVVGKSCTDLLEADGIKGCPFDKCGSVINHRRACLRGKERTIPILKSVTEMQHNGERFLVESLVEISAIEEGLAHQGS